MVFDEVGMIFYMRSFPKFMKEFFDDECNTWEESLRNNGYPSAQYDLMNGDFEIIEMDNIEYTHFVLRWS